MSSTRITAPDLLARIERGSAPAILDVRSRWEFERGHVPGARHIPFWTMPVRISHVPASRASPVVLYCGHGPRALLAGAVLRAAGFRHLLSLEGHMQAWRRGRLPETTGKSPSRYR